MIIDELGGGWGAEYFGNVLNKETEDSKIEGKQKYGVEYYKLPPDELAKWIKKLEPVQDEWIKGMESKGLAAKKVFEEYKRFVKL